MKYAILDYMENGQFFNVGDNIQSLAAKQFLPNMDVRINRERMTKYQGGPTKIILNGWFTQNAANWIPSKDIIPLFISFHINNTAADLMLSKEGIAYLKKYQPIGTRDHYTKNLLQQHGIDAYFSGCLTLTLDSYKVPESERTDDIYIVDPLYGYPLKRKVFRNIKYLGRGILNGKIFELNKRKNHIKKIISSELLQSAIYINQEPPAFKYTSEEKFQMAEDILQKYAKAKLVITSRIHCALPCLAMGTPVIFINGFETFTDSSRFEGILDLFNRIDINSKTGEWTSNFGLTDKITKDTKVKNLEKHHELAEKMKTICKDFINKA
ncbi:MAG TPA: polysaccharide pyruvyl transferase family protein [Edaphocola sp.]|nr:polysaccharide pyruvyl transferase family protein [Edaphocola sp.]